MTERVFNPARRNVLKLGAVSIALAPLAALVAARPAAASDLPHLAEDDPQAVAMKYKADATQAPRVDKAGTAAAQQTCANCQLAQGAGEWLGCPIFQGRAVSASGWCTAWVPKA
jgi:hypothetical protein